jgi:hypothetical protein
MPRDTDQQIKDFQKFKDYDAEQRRRLYQHTVDNAVFQDRQNNNPAPLDMLERIAKMPGQDDLRAILEDALCKQKTRVRYTYAGETERLFLKGQGIGTLQEKYRIVYGENPPPMSAVGGEQKKQEYIDGLIEAIVSKKLELRK